jgi:hypothetical protein
VRKHHTVVFFSAVNASVPASEEQVLAACEQALRLAPSEWPPTLPPSEKLWGAPEWYSFELDAWPIGESIRRAFVQRPYLKKRTGLISKVAEVATCRNLRRGRQSFIMAMGFVAACHHASALVPFLTDSDVDGQVVHTLLKMRAAGYRHSVAPLLQSEKAWIRRLARTYVERYPTEKAAPTS